MVSNFAKWQHAKVSSRMELLRSVLVSAEKYKTKFDSITSLAKMVAERIMELEGYDGNEVCKPLSYTTLLRKNGPYRSLLESYLLKVGVTLVDSSKYLDDPVFQRILDSKDTELDNLKIKHRRLQDTIKAKTERSLAEFSPLGISSDERQALGEAAQHIFNLLLSTGVYKFDQASGEVLYVARVRRVALSRDKIATFLNWQIEQDRDRVDLIEG